MKAQPGKNDAAYPLTGAGSRTILRGNKILCAILLTHGYIRDGGKIGNSMTGSSEIPGADRAGKRYNL